MKKLLLLALVILSANLKAQTIIVQAADGSNPRTFTSIDDAVANAIAGDYVYLEHGTYNITSTWKGYNGTGSIANFLVVEKPLHFVGNGYYYPAEATTVNGMFALRKSSSGSTVTGIRFNNHIYLDSVSNVEITRCYNFNPSTTCFINLCGKGTGNIITECYIGDISGGTTMLAGGNGNNVSWSSYENTVVSKNIFWGGIHYNKNLFVTNNIFTPGGSSNVIANNDNLTIQNNIFNGDGNNPINGSTTNSTIKNNIMQLDYQQGATNTYQNNFVESIANTFVNFNSSGTGDYHLKPTSVGILAGSDGTDIGIYGTATPFKENRRTTYPWVTAFNIGSETNQASQLKVNATVEAQEK